MARPKDPGEQPVMPSSHPELRQLAQHAGVELSYRDAAGQVREAGLDALLRVLQVLGAPVARAADAPDALRERVQGHWRRVLEPVSVVWDDGPAEVAVRLPGRSVSPHVTATLRFEDGATSSWTWEPGQAATADEATVEGVPFTVKRLTLPAKPAAGYHRLSLDVAGQGVETLLLVAPRRAFDPDSGRPRSQRWGVFLPAYAAHSQHSWGSGDLTDLQGLLDWVSGLGGSMVATLPLLAAFLDEPFEPSPYSPVSRLFWNEFYLDVTRAPELAHSPAAQALLASSPFRAELEALRAEPLVDYRRGMALKRRVLAELARGLFAEPSSRRDACQRFLASHPGVEDYARFRAVGERLRTTWPNWPAPLRDGTIGAGDFNADVMQYHAYVQWLAEEQLQELSARARAAGPGMYLDLPLGVHGDGYDVWRERGAFAVGIDGGCPPDVVFPRGQNWGFPPLHPEGIRDQGYRYVTAFVRHQMRLAGVLRIDHMPCFHRLFWIPHGLEAKDGVYVRYPSDELYALFNLESHRHRTLLVGEDLGTLPPDVHPAMERHHFHTMYVVQYFSQPEPERALPPVPATAVASLETHDMPPFAGFWEGRDVQDRQDFGLMGQQDPAQEKQRRQAQVRALVHFLKKKGVLAEAADVGTVLRACLAYLRASPTPLVLVNLEDLWLETKAQNVPSTRDEHPNWRRKARHSLEEIGRMPELAQVLRAAGFPV